MKYVGHLVKPKLISENIMYQKKRFCQQMAVTGDRIWRNALDLLQEAGCQGTQATTSHLRLMSSVSRRLERHNSHVVWLVIHVQRNIVQKTKHDASIGQLHWNVARNAATTISVGVYSAVHADQLTTCSVIIINNYTTNIITIILLIFYIFPINRNVVTDLTNLTSYTI